MLNILNESSYYNQIFKEFLEPTGNQQYHFMLHLERELFAMIQRYFNCFSTTEVLRLLDLCCGEGTNLLILIQAIKNITGIANIQYLGADIQPESIYSANQVIDSLKREKFLADTSAAQVNDVFKKISGFPDEQKADVLTLRHGLYYMKTDVKGYMQDDAVLQSAMKVKEFIKEAMNQIKENGFALMFHETNNSDLFSEKFNYKCIDGAVIPKMTDAAEQIEAAAFANGYKIAQVSFSPKLYFPVLTKEEVSQLKTIHNKDELMFLNPNQQRWVRLLLFAIQPPKEELEKFIFSSMFCEYVNKIEQVHAVNQRQLVEGELEPPYLYIHQRMQVITTNYDLAAKLQFICGILQENINKGFLERMVQIDMRRIAGHDKITDREEIQAYEKSLYFFKPINLFASKPVETELSSKNSLKPKL